MNTVASLPDRLAMHARDCVKAADMDTDVVLSFQQIEAMADDMAEAAAALASPAPSAGVVDDEAVERLCAQMVGDLTAAQSRKWWQYFGGLHDADDLRDLVRRLITALTTPAAAPSVSPAVEGGLHDFTEWLAREMPPGTVISDPRWWAPRIARRLATPEQPGSAVQGEAALGLEYWFADCDDSDYSGLFNSSADASTQVDTHGGRVIRLREYHPHGGDGEATPPPAPAADPLATAGDDLAEQYRKGWEAGRADALGQHEARGVEGMVLVPSHYAENVGYAAAMLEQSDSAIDRHNAPPLRTLATLLASGPELTRATPPARDPMIGRRHDEPEAYGYAQGWNDCRAATLAATPNPVRAEQPEGKGTMSLHDRVEFALRDAGFDYDEAFALAQKAAAPGAAVGVDEDAIERAVRAHDREDAGQKGEPDPWADEFPEPYRSERMTAMRLAFQAAALAGKDATA